MFEKFEERDDVEQIIVGPTPSITGGGIVPEDYSDFGIKNIKFYSSSNDIQCLVNSFSPNVYVQASIPVAKDIKLPKGCKKVYVSHGMVGSHVKGIAKKLGNMSSWKGCDLYCGATEVFADWIKHVAGVADDKILLNALPQLDILYDKQYYESYRDKVLSRMRIKNPSKIILFAGFCCRDRVDFDCHNEDYFKTVIELDRLARKNNWLVMVKPRQTHSVMMKFLKSHVWGNRYIQPYTDAYKSEHLHFITTTGHIYRYFFADCMVINGTSTIEVEACAIQKPLFIVRTGCDRTDPYDMVGSGTAVGIVDMEDLQEFLENFEEGLYHYPEKQKQWFINHKLTLDGKMHKRIQSQLVWNIDYKWAK